MLAFAVAVLLAPAAVPSFPLRVAVGLVDERVPSELVVLAEPVVAAVVVAAAPVVVVADPPNIAVATEFAFVAAGTKPRPLIAAPT